MSISFDRSYMVLSAKLLDQNIEEQLMEMNLGDDTNKHERWRIELYQISLAQAYNQKDAYFRPIFKNGNPQGPIMEVAIAISKNIVASVGADKYLRIWEFVVEELSFDSIPSKSSYKQLSCYFSKEVMHSVSIHPMGYQLAVGTREGIKIFYIIENELKLGIEIHGKVSFSIKYSWGGQFLASGSGTSIQIIDPYTFQTMYILTGHPSNVRYLKWTESDSHLISYCNHGSWYGWSSNFEIYRNRNSKSDRAEPERIEFNVKHVQLKSVVYDEEFDLCWYSTDDGKIKIMTTKNGCKSILEMNLDDGVHATCMVLAK